MAFYYQEKQNFRKLGIWILLSASMIPVNGVLLYGCSQQLIAGMPWGSEPMSDTSLVITTLVVLIFSLAIFWLFFIVELEFEIKDKSVNYQLYPFKKNVIQFSDLQSWEVKSIDPIMGFGGYGLRITSKSKAYIINGKNALILKPKDGKQVVLDTKKPEATKNAMEKEWQLFNEY